MGMKKSLTTALTALLLLSGSAQAFMLGGTRLVLEQDRGVASIAVYSGEREALKLVHSQVLTAQDGGAPSTHFMVTPPLFRLEPGAQGQVRVSLVDPQGLPVDRESRLYLKVIAIPSINPLGRNDTTGFTGGALLVNTGSIIKLFYRPHGLAAPTQGGGATLTFTRVPGGVQVHNPTPWYVTLGDLRIDDRPVTFSSQQAAELPPFGTTTFGTTSRLKQRAQWRVLDDAGKSVGGTTPIR
ncbi:molecular chaperone [Serratia marcescens]|uniref:Molecular chaperone n=1 Tax=Serratia marcescens TaxID=615 RepID=A0A5C7BTC9_SERMA|nr:MULTISPECIES: molecular chaperone [Serratia]TXE24468.1 molecular chaperone [Serratia marcescens]TXE53304.1 molecular chaperone [Serratia marcescens]